MEIHKKNISAAAVLSGQITVPKVSEEWRKEIQGEWDRIAKPLGSFGKLEKIHTAIGAIQQRRVPDLERMELLVCCGDHGIVEEGVSQSGQEVTAICAENIGKGQSCAGILAAAAHAKIRAIDVGLHHPGPVPGTEFRRVADGTRNFLKEPAMSRAQFRTALQLGLDLAAECRKAGVRVLGVGEMGIGNTTSAAVLAGRMLGLSAETVTGRGAGLDGAGLQRKRKVIAAALKMPDVSSDVEAIWCRFGGLELTAMMGIILGGRPSWHSGGAGRTAEPGICGSRGTIGSGNSGIHDSFSYQPGTGGLPPGGEPGTGTGAGCGHGCRRRRRCGYDDVPASGCEPGVPGGEAVRRIRHGTLYPL